MNELDLVSELRAGVPAPTPARLAVGRQRLVDSIAPRRGHLRMRVAAVAVCLALIAVAAVGVEGAGHQAPPPVVRASLANQVLRTAALSAASRPAVIPRPGQWMYTRVIGYSLGAGRTASDGWLRFDGGAEAYYQGGQLIVHSVPGAAGPTSSPLRAFLSQPTPATAYRALASLPANPVRLLAEVARQVPPSSIAGSGWDPARGRATAPQREFGFLAELLWNSAEAAPPRVEATLFAALADIPGVRAQRAVSDADGRPAIALSISGVDQQLLLDPRNYQVTGERTLSNGSWPVAAGGGSATVPAGEVVQSLAWARVAFVSDPGRY